MKKQWISLVGIILVCVFVFVGCDSSAGAPSAEPSAEKTAGSAPTESAAISSAPAAATAAPSASAAGETPQAAESTLTVSATESVKKMPDIAYVSIGVRTAGDSAEAAQQENARITEAFLAAVKAEGISEDDLETQNISVYADYENPQKTVMENTYRLTIRDIGKVGAVIDAALNAGANTTYSLSFDLADRDSVYMEALAKAMENVGGKAKAVAQAGGYTIVRPQSILEGSSGYSAQPYMMETGAAADMGGGKMATPVTPQEIEVSATVTGTYVIE